MIKHNIDCKNFAKICIKKQSDALQNLSSIIDDNFTKLVDYILNIKGRVILLGVGKSGYIAKK